MEVQTSIVLSPDQQKKTEGSAGHAEASIERRKGRSSGKVDGALIAMLLLCFRLESRGATKPGWIRVGRGGAVDDKIGIAGGASGESTLRLEFQNNFNARAKEMHLRGFGELVEVFLGGRHTGSAINTVVVDECRVLTGEAPEAVVEERANEISSCSSLDGTMGALDGSIDGRGMTSC